MKYRFDDARTARQLRRYGYEPVCACVPRRRAVRLGRHRRGSFAAPVRPGTAVASGVHPPGGARGREGPGPRRRLGRRHRSVAAPRDALRPAGVGVDGMGRLRVHATCDGNAAGPTRTRQLVRLHRPRRAVGRAAGRCGWPRVHRDRRGDRRPADAVLRGAVEHRLRLRLRDARAATARSAGYRGCGAPHQGAGRVGADDHAAAQRATRRFQVHDAVHRQPRRRPARDRRRRTDDRREVRLVRPAGRPRRPVGGPDGRRPHRRDLRARVQPPIRSRPHHAGGSAAKSHRAEARQHAGGGNAPGPPVRAIDGVRHGAMGRRAGRDRRARRRRAARGRPAETGRRRRERRAGRSGISACCAAGAGSDERPSGRSNSRTRRSSARSSSAGERP